MSTNPLRGSTQMCEICVVDPEKLSIGEIVSLSQTLYEANSDGLGVVAVHRDVAEGQFNYLTYKSEDPNLCDFTDFVVEQHDHAWRFIVHARLATAGGCGQKQTHPIAVDCTCTDAKMVIHNGIVSGDESRRNRLSANGHKFTTEVDTEVIAHTLGSVPRSFESESGGYSEAYETMQTRHNGLYGRLNYLLLAEDRILVRTDGKYRLSNTFEMHRSSRSIDCIDGEVGMEWLLVSPEGTESIDRKDGSGYTAARSQYTGTRSRGRSQTPTTSRSQTSACGLSEDLSETERAARERAQGDAEAYWEGNEKYEGDGDDRGYGGGGDTRVWVEGDDGKWYPKPLDAGGDDSGSDGSGVDSATVADIDDTAEALAYLFGMEDRSEEGASYFDDSHPTVDTPCQRCDGTLYDHGSALVCHDCHDVTLLDDGEVPPPQSADD